MRGAKALVALFVIAVVAPVSRAQEPAHSDAAPLGTEQTAVYRGFLERFSSPLHVRNLSNVTVPFDFKGFPETRPCLKGIELESDSAPFRATHVLDEGVTKGMGIRLVDSVQKRELLEQRDFMSKDRDEPALSDRRANTNVLVLSEVVFDTGHQFALVKYLLLCGQHCASGATLVMEKTGGEWTVSSRRLCATFIGVEQQP